MNSDLKKYYLSDASDVITGFPFKGEKYSSSGTRVLRGENVTIGNLRWDTIKCWNEPFKEIEKYTLEEGDIVIGMDGSRVGKNRAQIRKEELPLILAQRVARLRARINFSQDFLAYVIKSNLFEQYVEAIKTGTTIPHISPQQIKEFEFYAPNKETQHLIATILSSLDDKIELNRQTNQTLEAIAQTLFQEMCIHKGEELPEGWRVGKLGEVCKNIRKTANPKDFETDIPYVGLEHIPRKSLCLNDYGISSDVSSQKSIFNEYDILFGKLRPYFHKVCIAPIKGICSTDILVIEPLIKEWFSFCVNHLYSDELIKYVSSIADGTRMPRVDWKSMSDYEILIPPKESMKKLNEICLPFYKNMLSNNKENQTLIALRDSLLPKLMKGEIEI